MSVPQHYRDLNSLLCRLPDFDKKLSEALDEIGLNDEMIQKRRRNELLHETLGTTVTKLKGYDRPEYHFGSRSEGTTTLGLQSDIDRLYCVKGINVIQSRTELKPEDSSNTMNLLMIQDDENIAPGYCHLEVLNEKLRNSTTDVKLANDHYVRQGDGRIFYKNTIMEDFIPGEGERHGPSWAATGPIGFIDTDTVAAFHCKSWPYQASDWLGRPNIGGWPTEGLRRECMTTGCFVVPTGSNPNSKLEWRISTSIAERKLMFSLNTTQLRCYVLMKMLIKTFMKETQKDKISSFMCKSVLLYCVESSLPDEWQESSLSQCFMKCLQRLQTCIQDENCPHFIIPKNNLMANKFSTTVKKNLLEMMEYVTRYIKLVLAKAIKFDNLSNRLKEKVGMPTDGEPDLSPQEISCHIKASCFMDTAIYLRVLQRSFLVHMLMALKNHEFLLNSLESLDQQKSHGDEFQQEVRSLLAPFISSFLGSMLAARFGNTSNTYQSDKALALLNVGLHSDVSSGRLKLASVYYCMKDTENTVSILQETEAKYNQERVEPICRCTDFPISTETMDFSKFEEEENEVVQNTAAFCVIFLPCEMRCVPKELQYEMFRTFGEDIGKESAEENTSTWEWAVVDSLPYLYFLQYKVYRQLDEQDDKQRALLNMRNVTKSTPNLGHRETAWNLLGQCMEEENMPIEALQCYTMSLNLRPRNNAAKIHICKCLANMFQHCTTTIYEREPNDYS